MHFKLTRIGGINDIDYLHKRFKRMKKILFLLVLLISSCGTVSNIETSFQKNKEAIKSENTVTDVDALKTLAAAHRKNAFIHSISRQSVAQIVFPKIVKGGFIVGGNYGEGFLLRNGQVVANIDLAGGNFGLQAGVQSYSQVTYILSEKKYSELLNTNRLSLTGTIAYGVNGEIQSTLISTDSIVGDLYTIITNETGSLYGVSLEGLYYTVR